MSRAALSLLVLLGACAEPTPRRSSVASLTPPTDSAFALVQTRGQAAMGVNQYTSTHRFEPLADGGLIILQRNADDPAGAAQIRAHIMEIAQAFRRGDFAVPGFVHDRRVPGTATMAARRARISYTTDTLPRGGSLRIQSDDSLAVAAIHEFLAFQRLDHRFHSGQVAR